MGGFLLAVGLFASPCVWWHFWKRPDNIGNHYYKWWVAPAAGTLAFFAFLAPAMVIGLPEKADSPPSHCATAAAARYKYVPGGPTGSMTSDAISRCESGNRSLFR